MVFIVNYAMDFILLTIADGFLKNNAGYRRVAMAAFIVAVWSCVSQTGVITNAVIRDIFTYVIISLIMAFICTKRQHGWKIAEYCRKEDIRCVVVGDIRNIRKEKDMGHKTNQKFHGLPYNKLYIMLGYKLKLYGIQLIKQEESYTSQCCPLSPEVSKR